MYMTDLKYSIGNNCALQEEDCLLGGYTLVHQNKVSWKPAWKEKHPCCQSVGTTIVCMLLPFVTSGKICCNDEFTHNINYTSLPYKKIRRTTAALVTLILYIAHANTRTGKMWIQTLWILNSHISFKNTRQPAYSRRKTHLTALHYIGSPSTASACISSA